MTVFPVFYESIILTYHTVVLLWYSVRIIQYRRKQLFYIIFAVPYMFGPLN